MIRTGRKRETERERDRRKECRSGGKTAIEQERDNKRKRPSKWEG